ncbi:MAG: GDP-mannose 4,6-dehydratase [Acidimicrobiales bacterium]
MRTAFITGISGQDGSYLAEFLLARGYTVHGLVRRSSSVTTWRLDGIYEAPQEAERLILHYGDVTDGVSLSRLFAEIRPDEVYNLAAQSHVMVSFQLPEATADATALGALRVLEALRAASVDARFYQASSSEMFGSTPPPQNEISRLHPRSPYGVSKVFAHHATVNYREAYDMFAVSGILFNHESPRRGETFVTRKITRAVAAIEAGRQEHLYLGNLDARRDWGFAGDYVDAMWRMVTADEPADFVIGTGVAHSVREFCELAFGHVGLDWERYVRHDDRYERPAEVENLVADASAAEAQLGWTPTVDFASLVAMMVEADRAPYR